MEARPSATQHSNSSAGEPIEYKELKGYLDNLAHAATSEKAVLQQLSAAVALLTATNSTLMKEIKELTADKKYLGCLSRSVNTDKPIKGEEKGRWKKANPGRFIVDGYCHTQDYPIGKDHASGPCSNPGPQQKREATCTNLMGMCKDFSGW